MEWFRGGGGGLRGGWGCRKREWAKVKNELSILIYC